MVLCAARLVYNYTMFNFLVRIAHAQQGAGSTARHIIDNPINIDNILDLITKILEIMMQIGLPVIAIALVYVGLKYVMAQGNPAEIKKAHEAFLWVVIGAAIVLGAIVIRTIIQGTVDSLQP